MLNTRRFLAFTRFRVAVTFLWTAAAVAAVAGQSAAAVFGTDERLPLAERDQAFMKKIGMIVSSENGAYCTAFCVAPDVIVTASHCLFGTAVAAAPRLTSLSFKTAAGTAATSLAAATRTSESKAVISGTTHLRVAPPIGAAQDWAVARLAAPACASGGLRLSDQTPSQIHAAAARGAIYQIAIHADLPDTRLRRGGPCDAPASFPSANAETIARDFAAPGAILFHTCDTGGGSSGSPLLIDTPSGPEVIAINVGTYVLSRSVTTAQDKGAPPVSEPIANTAIWISAIAGAVRELRKHEPRN